MVTRRDILRTGAATGAAFATLLLVRPVLAKPADMEAAIRAFTGTAPVSNGKVELVLPALVENGNSVPLTVNVAHWMEPNDYVKTIAIFNEKNPQPNVATFHLTPRAGRAIGFHPHPPGRQPEDHRHRPTQRRQFLVGRGRGDRDPSGLRGELTPER